MRTCYFCCMRACVCMCMTFEMAESDSEAAVSYVCHPFSHSRVICPMLLHPHIVHLCVHTHVHTCSRHPPERDCTDVCSYHLRVCSCSSKKFLHYHLSFLMTSWCFLELSCRCRSSRLETHTYPGARSVGIELIGHWVSLSLYCLSLKEGCYAGETGFQKKVVFLPKWRVVCLFEMFCILRPTPPLPCLFKNSCFVGCFHHGKLGILILFLKIVCCVWISPGVPQRRTSMSRKVPRLKETKRQLHSILETHLMRSEALGKREDGKGSLLAHPKCALHLQLPGGPCWLRGGGKMMVSEAVVRRRRVFQPAAPAAWSRARLHHNSYCVSLINALLKLWNYKRKKRRHLFRLLIH